MAIVTLKAENMQKGKTYNAKLTLSDADVALKDTVTNNMLAESTISIMCDYEWEDAGIVTFTEDLSIMLGAGTSIGLVPE